MSNVEDEGSGEGSESNELNFSLELAPPSPTKTPRKPQREFVFLLKNQEKPGEREIVQLHHPRTGKLAMFMFDGDNGVIEVTKQKRVPSSYFIDQTVVEDGSMYLTSPIDPLFLLLNRLDLVRNKKAESDEGIAVERSMIEAGEKKFPHLRRLFDFAEPSVEAVCDIQEVDDVKYYRLNDTKVLDWLKHKVDAVADFVSSSSFPGALKLVRAQASGYRAKKGEVLTETQILEISVGFVSAYLSKKWATKLKASYASVSIVSHASAPIDEKRPAAVPLDDEFHMDYMPAKYGKAVDNVGRKRTHSEADLGEEKGPAAKKAKVKAHEKVDVRKNTRLTSFFTPKK